MSRLSVPVLAAFIRIVFLQEPITAPLPAATVAIIGGISLVVFVKR